MSDLPSYEFEKNSEDEIKLNPENSEQIMNFVNTLT
jgi:hypothetical protein